MCSRKKPCQYCKKRRRRCEKPNSDEPCRLCQLKGVSCVPVGPSYSYYLDPSQEQTDYHRTYRDVLQISRNLESLTKELASLEGIRQQNAQWQLQLKDGQLKLLSEIKNLQEFKLYGKAALTYLPPFLKGALHTGWPVLSSNSTSFVRPAIQQLLQNQQHHSPFNHRTILRNLSKDHFAWRTPRGMMLPLIDHYFSCCNTLLPILHESSYRIHLVSLKDPLKDPVVNAICAAACVSQCKHTLLESFEKRFLGECYFQQSIELLLDMFDDPNKALDTLLTINLLQTFMLTTLRVSECKKWITIGIAIALDLRSQSRTTHTYVDHVRQAIIERNRILIFVSAHTLDFYAEGKCMDIPAIHLKFDILPDDCPRAKETLKVINCICQFLFDPSYIQVGNYVRAMAVGKPYEILLENAIRSEEAIQSWWQRLPGHFKLANTLDAFSQEGVDNCTSTLKLTMAVSSLIVMMSIETALLDSAQIRYQQETVFSLHAFEKILYSIDISILIIRQLDRLGFCSSPIQLLVRMIDCLVILVSRHCSVEPEKLKSRMTELMLEFSKRILPDHQVPITESPYFALSMASSVNKIPTTAELYQDYPLPAEALLFDVLQTTVQKVSILT